MTPEIFKTVREFLANSNPKSDGPLERLSTLRKAATNFDWKGFLMAFVVTSPCDGCKYTDCVVVCPCECFREGERMLYIKPQDCVDCAACAPECPVDAIFHEDEVPADQLHFIALNAEMAERYPPITERKKPLKT